MAVETDVRETISAAKVAFVCGLWSVGVVALLSAGFIARLIHMAYLRNTKDEEIAAVAVI